MRRAKPALALVESRPFAPPARPAGRGYVVLYRPGLPNHCPGCGRQQWEVGRRLAECAFCATALFIAGAGDPV